MLHRHPEGRHRLSGLFGRLFWRVYGHGLLLLLVVLLTVVGVGWAIGRNVPTREPGRVARYVAQSVGAHLGDAEALGAELRRVHEALGTDITLYDAQGRLLASNVDPPLGPLPSADLKRIDVGPIHLHGGTWGSGAPLPDGAGYLVLAGTPREGFLTRAAAIVAAVLLALALGSIPLARSISAPLERLTVAARALGAGDLSVRTGLRLRGDVGELAAAFDEMAERLQRLVRSEQELLANVSHELRTPLTRIRLALELAEEGDVARARKALGEIGEDLAELERLVTEIMAAARLDLAGAGQLPLHREAVEPGSLVEEVAARFRTQSPDRILQVELGEPLPTLDADAALLRRLLGLLLDNARKYSEPPTPVTLAARAEVGALVLEVRDQGIGIPAEDLPRVFTPFFRTDRSRARGTGGVGMGLALARRIAEAHGGSIRAESAPGEGTRLTVRLPA